MLSLSLPLLQSTLGDTLGLVHLGGIADGLERVAGGREGLEVCAVLFVGLQPSALFPPYMHSNINRTYKRQTAVAAGSNLGLVGVDEDLGVAEGTAAAVAADDALLRPADGLLVDELDGSHGLGLRSGQHSLHYPLRSFQIHDRLSHDRG